MARQASGTFYIGRAGIGLKQVLANRQLVMIVENDDNRIYSKIQDHRHDVRLGTWRSGGDCLVQQHWRHRKVIEVYKAMVERRA